MGKLNNLIKDIDKIFINDKQPSEEDLQTFANDVLEAVRDSFMKREHTSGEAIRFSSIGRPDRQLWYKHKIPTEAEEVHPSTRIKFIFGHMIEQLVFLLIKTAGYKVTSQQDEKVIDGIKGHMDGRVNGVVVDVKSASPHGFNQFESGGIFFNDPFGYIAQISGYADEEDEAAFIVMNKVNGKLHVLNIDELERINFKERVSEVKKMVANTEPPERCYEVKPDGKSGNMKLPIGCIYCDFKKVCWEDANDGKGLRVFDYKDGKRFFVTVKREPQAHIKEVSL